MYTVVIETKINQKIIWCTEKIRNYKLMIQFLLNNNYKTRKFDILFGVAICTRDYNREKEDEKVPEI